MSDQHSSYFNNPYHPQQQGQYPPVGDVNLLNFSGPDRAQETSDYFPTHFPQYDVPYQPDYPNMPEPQHLEPNDEPIEYPPGTTNPEDVTSFNLPSERELAFQKRREQNRIAQKKFRKRKETNIKQLEDKLAALSKDYKELKDEHGDLRSKQVVLEQEMELLAEENRRLKTSIGSSPASTTDSTWWPAGSDGQYSQRHGSGRGSTSSMSPTARSRVPST